MVFSIDSLVTFPGEQSIAIGWLKPTNEPIDAFYEYKLYESSGVEPGSWSALGTPTDLKSLDVGSTLDIFYTYKFDDLTSGTEYTIKVRAREESNPTSTEEGSTTTATPEIFKSDEPTPERLMRGLDGKYNKESSSNLYQIMHTVAVHIRDFYTNLKEQALNQLNILTATEEFVDNWGLLFKVSRQSGESDPEFAARIVRTVIIEKSTPNGIKEALLPYARNGDINLIEGNQNFNSFHFDLSYFDYDPYVTGDAGTAHTINFKLNDLEGTTEIGHGNEFSSQGIDSFSILIRISAIESGDPASKANTLRIVANILDMYKIAGTTYSIYDNEYDAFIQF